MPIHRTITDLVDEQRVAHLIENATDIIDHCKHDPSCAIHINGWAMATRLRAAVEARREELLNKFVEDCDECLETLRDMNYADQLAAHHLDMLDRLAPA